MIPMEFNPIIKIIILVAVITGFSYSAGAQQLASQKPLSAFYSKNTEDWLASRNVSNRQGSSLQNQRNLPSVKPLPKQATDARMKNPQVARNTVLPESEKIKKLPSKSALTVNQIAVRKPANQKPPLH
jgi:hypothetical protein